MPLHQRITRRAFAGAAVALGAGLASAAQPRPGRILLRSSWQSINIGDIGHTPGVLRLLEQHLPTAEVVVWASATHTADTTAMLTKRFPKLKVVKGAVDADGKTAVKELDEAIGWADFFLHSSGPSLVAAKDLAAFEKRTGKPFGVYGITYGGAAESVVKLLGRAQFAYFRDTVSLAKAKADGVACPVTEFAPDGAFAVDLRADDKAEAYLKASGLEAGKFLVAIPRWRNTPRWALAGRPPAGDEVEKEKTNHRLKEQDHRPVREAIVSFVRETGLKVLVCPEDMTQMSIGKEQLVDPLPADVRKQVVWRERFWNTDEALSTYVRSVGLLSMDMHSPIMAVGNGIPAVHLRFKEQTSKGVMWKDVGLGDWLFDLDAEVDAARLTAAVVGFVKDPAGTKAKVEAARAFVRKRQAETMAVVGKAVIG
jgi:polysaccharide pyruvyl transferase WcaK-like protein